MANLGIGAIAAHAGRQSGRLRVGDSEWGALQRRRKGARHAHAVILASGRKLCQEANAARRRKRLNQAGITAEAVLRQTVAMGNKEEAERYLLMQAAKPAEETIEQRAERIEMLFRQVAEPVRVFTQADHNTAHVTHHELGCACSTCKDWRQRYGG